MIRVLHVVPPFKRGGIESFIMNLYRKIDRNQVQFDFLASEISADYENEIITLGGRVFKAPLKTKKPILFFKSLKNVVKQNHYEIIHIHSFSAVMAIDFLIAKLGGATIRIAHSHSSKDKVNISLKRNMKQYIFRFPLNLLATHRFACSFKAAIWMFGKKQHNVKIIKNAINCEDYKFNKRLRNNIREELNINENLVIGNIGRFVHQKNQEFLLLIFFELKKIYPKSKMLLIGEGALKDSISKKVAEQNLSQDVIFLGVRDDVNELLQAMDAFVLPSFYEGLPVSAIEAQASGLPVFLSNTISEETNLGSCTYLDLKLEPSYWAKKIIDTCKQHIRSDTMKQIKYLGYDMENVASEIQKFYLKT